MRITVRDQLEKNGFVVLEDFLQPAECDELRAAGHEMTFDVCNIENRQVFSTSETENQKLKEDYFINSNDKIRYFFEADALDSEGNFKVDPSVSLNKVGHALHLLHPNFRCYTYSERVKAVCRELGLHTPAVVQSMYIYNNPGAGGEVAAHQDATYLYAEPVPPTGFWIALEDATIENGCLWISRGSHKSGVHRRLKRNPDKHAEEQLVYDKPPPVYPQSIFTAIPVRKGTCILLHGLVVHKSGNNSSCASRPAYSFHVVEIQHNNYSEDNWLQEGPGAQFLNIHFTPEAVDLWL